MSIPYNQGHRRLDVRSPVLVIGAGGHAKVVIQIIRELGLQVAGILDDEHESSDPIGLVQLLGPISKLSEYDAPQAVVAIGDNAARRQIVSQHQARWLTLVHPKSYVAPSARLDPGVVVCANATVGEDAVIGAHAIINTNASVDHDAQVGEFSHVACGVTLAGGASVGTDTLIGAGATVLPSISIGNRSILGAGGVATKNIDDDIVAYGVPAEKIRSS